MFVSSDGVMIPERPVDSAANVLPETVTPADPAVEEGGGNIPWLPSMLLV